MNSISLLLLFAFVAYGNGAAVIQVSDIGVSPHADSYNGVRLTKPRLVEGIVDCGASGEIVDVTFTECNLVPCQTWVDNVYTVQVKFKPSLSHPSMRLQLQLIHEGESEGIVDTDVPNSAVEAGVQYAFGYSMRITGAFLGPATIAFRLFGFDAVEICFIVGIIVEDPRTHVAIKQSNF